MSRELVVSAIYYALLKYRFSNSVFERINWLRQAIAILYPALIEYTENSEDALKELDRIRAKLRQMYVNPELHRLSKLMERGSIDAGVKVFDFVNQLDDFCDRIYAIMLAADFTNFLPLDLEQEIKRSKQKKYQKSHEFY